MNTSDPPRNMIARNPSHLGSYRNAPSVGSSSASFASIGSIGGVIAKRPRCAGVDTPGSGFFRSALMMRDSKSRVQVLESAVPQNIANLLTQLNEAAGTGIDVASFWQQHASRQIRRS